MATTLIKSVVDFSGESDANLLKITDKIIAGMTDNPHFTNPIPAVPVLKAKRDSYDASLTAAGTGNRADIAQKNANREELEEELGTMGNYVNTIARGNQAVLATTMFPLTKEREPAYLGTIDNLKLTPGINAGTINCKLTRVKNAKSYTYHVTEDPMSDESVWRSFVSTSSKFAFENLVPGKKYWIKVTAVGTRGQSVQSSATAQYAQNAL